MLVIVEPCPRVFPIIYKNHAQTHCRPDAFHDENILCFQKLFLRFEIQGESEYQGRS
jgi:hypothetical protein